MLLMVKKIRREICHSTYRYEKSNNKRMKDYDKNNESSYTARKVSKCGVFPRPYFPLFQLNIDIYRVDISIKSK